MAEVSYTMLCVFAHFLEDGEGWAVVLAEGYERQPLVFRGQYQVDARARAAALRDVVGLVDDDDRALQVLV